MSLVSRYRAYTLTVVTLNALLFLLLLRQNEPAPSWTTFAFWICLMVTVDLLPVTLAFGTAVTMGFPIHLALAVIFPPWAAMAIAGLSSIDVREIKRSIPLHEALFNRSQVSLAVGMAAICFSEYGPDRLFTLPGGAAIIATGAFLHIFTNLILVTLAVHFDDGVPIREAMKEIVPKPAVGFWASYVLLTGLGSATVVVYKEVDFGAWAVAAFLVPLLFARLSILGARAQHELSEKVRKQQQALLAATEKVFEERENERKRIAEDIHDTSLQMLAAASYGAGNARDFLDSGRDDKALESLSAARDAIEDAMKELRASLVDLRKSAVEHGGLVETIKKFADQVSTVWGADVRIEGELDHEPPIPVALAAVQILQEGLVNALKHAGNGAVVIKIGDVDGMVHLAVEDDGPGFDPQAEVGADHVGMRLMKERAARVGGRIEIDSRPGSGTRLEAILPGGVTP
jgi:signal transduction histidine kinase